MWTHQHYTACYTDFRWAIYPFRITVIEFWLSLISWVLMSQVSFFVILVLSLFFKDKPILPVQVQNVWWRAVYIWIRVFSSKCVPVHVMAAMLLVLLNVITMTNINVYIIMWVWRDQICATLTTCTPIKVFHFKSDFPTRSFEFGPYSLK